MRIRDWIGAVSRTNSENALRRSGEALLLGAKRLSRSDPAALTRRMSGMSEIARLNEAEIESWADHDQVLDPSAPRRFDVCDLRAWLLIAQDAGVDAIPAREVASLSEEEYEALSEKIEIPADLRAEIAEGLSNGVLKEPENAAGVADLLSGLSPAEGDAAAAWAKIDGVLDELPTSWMVRTQYSGSGNLKALVGTGLMLKADDTAMVRPDFEIGGGWVRVGNRRVIDFADPRFLRLAVAQHKPGFTYLARPWAKPARYHSGEDIHRANTPLAGPGKWPAEWRVFVRNGEVTGVANYYAWTGEGATPQNAWNAIKAAALGQKLADKAGELGLVGVFLNQEMARRMTEDRPEIAQAFSGWDAGKFHASIDFMETEDGILFLEAGPAHSPGGGGHPCAFAGQGVDMSDPSRSVAPCEGVAYLAMPHVNLGDPRTWVAGDPHGSILGWEESLDLAERFAPLDPDVELFAGRILGAGYPAP